MDETVPIIVQFETSVSIEDDDDVSVFSLTSAIDTGEDDNISINGMSPVFALTSTLNFAAETDDESVQTHETIVATSSNDDSDDATLFTSETDRYFGDCGRRRFYEHTHVIKQKQYAGLLFSPQKIPISGIAKAVAKKSPKLQPLVHKSPIFKARQKKDDSDALKEIDDACHNFTESLTSPRSRFIGSCLHSRLNPRASLLIRQQLSKSLNIAHLGIGDTLCNVVIESIGELPLLNSIDVCDNNLTDASLAPLMDVVGERKTIESLNISHNKVGIKTARRLSAILAEENCPILFLNLANADVDDLECSHIISSLRHTTCMKELDMSQNKIGNAETLNTVIRSTLTGGEAFADFLQSKECKLEILKLAYNSIRLDSAIALTASVALNFTLTYLDLSFNALGNEAGVVLGQAIEFNKSLQTLLLSHTHIGSRACFVLSMGIVENESLRKVTLDGNPIGFYGSQALMKIPLFRGNTVELSYRKCGTTVKESGFRFDSCVPENKYALDLSDIFERAVAQALLHTAALSPTIVLRNCVLDGEAVDLVQKVLKTIESLRNDELTLFNQYKTMLLKLEDADSIQKMFRDRDVQDSGGIDTGSFHEIISAIDSTITKRDAEEIVRLFDVDCSGFITLEEVLMFVKVKRNEIIDRKLSLVEAYPTMVLASAPHKKYTLPRSGRLTLELSDTCVTKRLYYTMVTLDRKYLHDLATQCENYFAMIKHVFWGIKVRFDEAFALYEAMAKDCGQPLEVLSFLLPNMSSPRDAHRLTNRVVGGDINTWRHLKTKLGPSLSVLLGSYDRHYSLNLFSPASRSCLKRLFEVSTTQSHHVHRLGGGRIGDLSQYGDWSLFRNMTYNGEPIKISIDDFNEKLKTTGKLDFDFVTWLPTTPPDEIWVINDSRILELGRICCILDPAAVPAVDHVELESPSTEIHSDIVVQTVRAFYEGLSSRYRVLEQLHRDQLHEVVSTPWTASSSSSSSSQESRPTTMQRGGGMRRGSPMVAATHLSQSPVTVAPPLPTPRQSPAAISATKAAPVRNRRCSITEMVQANDVFVQNFHVYQEKMSAFRRFKVMASELSPAKKSSYIVDYLDEKLSISWLLCRQVGFLIHQFQVGTVDETTLFGSYRVELLTRLFSRIVDLENFPSVVRYLTHKEIGCLFARLGWLNVINPHKMDGFYALDLARWEERQVAKMLAMLSTREEGTNWQNVSFKHGHDLPPVPGWLLTEVWMADQGITHKGVLTVEYKTSGEPNRGFRNLLSDMTLVHVRRLALQLADECRGVGAAVPSRLSQDEDILDYFYPSNRKSAGESSEEVADVDVPK